MSKRTKEELEEALRIANFEYEELEESGEKIDQFITNMLGKEKCKRYFNDDEFNKLETEATDLLEEIRRLKRIEELEDSELKIIVNYSDKPYKKWLDDDIELQNALEEETNTLQKLLSRSLDHLKETLVNDKNESEEAGRYLMNMFSLTTELIETAKRQIKEEIKDLEKDIKKEN